MIRISLIIFVALSLAGCDAISHTHISAHPKLIDDARDPSAELIDAATEISEQFGLGKIEERINDISFTDSLLRLGQNPDIWLTIRYETTPIEIEISEMYIDHRTDKHVELANSLVLKLNTIGFDAKIISHTPDPIGLRWISFFIVFIGLATVVYCVFKRRHANHSHGNAK